MRGLMIALALLIGSTGGAFAVCFGGPALQNCFDNSGNSYTVQRFGNTTITNGYNPNTGSSWSQTDQRMGNSVFTNGTTNGRSWNMQRQYYGNGFSTYSGRDSRGNYFNGTCTRYGCN